MDRASVGTHASIALPARARSGNGRGDHSALAGGQPSAPPSRAPLLALKCPSCPNGRCTTPSVPAPRHPRHPTARTPPPPRDPRRSLLPLAGPPTPPHPRHPDVPAVSCTLPHPPPLTRLPRRPPPNTRGTPRGPPITHFIPRVQSPRRPKPRHAAGLEPPPSLMTTGQSLISSTMPLPPRPPRPERGRLAPLSHMLPAGHPLCPHIAPIRSRASPRSNRGPEVKIATP